MGSGSAAVLGVLAVALRVLLWLGVGVVIAVVVAGLAIAVAVAGLALERAMWKCPACGSRRHRSIKLDEEMAVVEHQDGTKLVPLHRADLQNADYTQVAVGKFTCANCGRVLALELVTR